ncbi:unnamed protein product [Citrullus colocynthis]|uniref:Uncharacterized protein n=1 Tax=Citrullus colocynthis TaxID=252529 RepID=A0ABP0XV18_9ROSI
MPNISARRRLIIVGVGMLTSRQRMVQSVTSSLKECTNMPNIFARRRLIVVGVGTLISRQRMEKTHHHWSCQANFTTNDGSECDIERTNMLNVFARRRLIIVGVGTLTSRQMINQCVTSKVDMCMSVKERTNVPNVSTFEDSSSLRLENTNVPNVSARRRLNIIGVNTLTSRQRMDQCVTSKVDVYMFVKECTNMPNIFSFEESSLLKLVH